ncbi:GNAT family N-acetyltransferase [Umezawaea beigongshangensis]|uniref:GNAT family N-acetyltransferase n=1 Tax=Umezawaea beigongshangensis TaxID=2780383 RepID=UPI0018F23B7B|nr:GNAT family N-acetyltransferase [Umezawaea beigongshangensis]
MRIRRLSADHLESCVALSLDRGWSPDRDKWAMLFDVAEVYGAVEDGKLVGTTVSTGFDDDLVAVSMVLVATAHGGRGIGRALVQHAVERAGTVPMTLYATDAGRPLYEKFDFRVTGHVTTHVGPWRSAGPRTTRFTADGDVPAVLEIDAAVHAVDRTSVLARFAAITEHRRVAEVDGVITGYGCTWHNGETTIVGPVCAADEATARALIADLAEDSAGPVRLDVDHRHPALARWAVEHGLTARGATAIMTRGQVPSGDRDRLFLPIMQALF